MQYVYNKKGEKTFVLIPYKDWKKLTTHIEKLQKRLEILTGISKGLQQIKAAKSNSKKMKTLAQALNEL